MRLAGRHAIVTGAAGGIGRATAAALVNEGAAVALADRNGDTVRRLADELTADGLPVIGIAADLSTEDGCRHVVERVIDAFGTVEVLFNNVGIIRRADVVTTTVDEWDSVFATNVRSIFLMCKLVVPLMAAQGGGSIINTGSGWGLKGGANAVSYCASKGAVVNLTRALAIDHGPQGIRVNSVNPGDTDTPMLREEARQLGEEERAFLADAADRPLRRVGRPEDIADAVVWLASDESSFVTGTALVVDGGGIA